MKRLTTHPAFSIRNPNKVYALIGGFRGNQVHFHAADGSGYAFLTEQVIALDAINPQVAARMARGFDRWKKFDARSEEHTSELQSHSDLVCRLLLEKKKKTQDVELSQYNTTDGKHLKHSPHRT